MLGYVWLCSVTLGWVELCCFKVCCFGLCMLFYVGLDSLM